MNTFSIINYSPDLEPEVPQYCKVTAYADRFPESGQLAVAELTFGDHRAFKSVFQYEAMGGRDTNGRFCKPGNPDEVVGSLDHLVFTRRIWTRAVFACGPSRR